jgi:hypothetical protein
MYNETFWQGVSKKLCYRVRNQTGGAHTAAWQAPSRAFQCPNLQP